MKYYLVNLVMPRGGMTMTVTQYIDALATLGYNRYQSLGSIGGAVTNLALIRNSNVLTRI